jgi:hypothetical protein
MKYDELVKIKLIFFFSTMLWMALVYFVAAILDYPNIALIITLIGFLIVPIVVFGIVREETGNFRRKKKE